MILLKNIFKNSALSQKQVDSVVQILLGSTV